MHLAESAEALAAMAKAISERADPVIQPAVLAAGGELKTAIDQLTAKIEHLAERGAERQPAEMVAGELKTAIDQLTAKVDQLGTKTFHSAAGRLYAQELQELLKKFD
jgi:hypothetical protein